MLGDFEFQGANLEAYLDGLDKLLSDISHAAAGEDDEALLALGIDRNNGQSNSINIRSAVIKFTKENAARLLNTQSEGSSTQGRTFIISVSGGDITVNMPSINKESLGLEGTNLLSQAEARKAMEALKKAVNSVSSWRGDMGSTYNRLEHTIHSIYTLEENLTSALSRICDADMAKEMMIFVKENLLAQASAFVMAQANQQPEQVISLLKSLN